MTDAENDNDFGKPPLRLTIPGLLDVLLVSEPAQMAFLDGHAALERQLDPKASPLHRFVATRLLEQLAFGDQVLPVFRARKDRDRGLRQQALSERLDRTRGQPGAERDELARYVSGAPSAEPIGVLVQRWCGRLFSPRYQSSAASYEAGRRIARFPSSGPWRSLASRLSGRLARDKQLVSARAEGDPHCIHATSIGTENIVRSLEKMRKAAQHPAHKHAAPDDILRSCLVAPPAVLRSVRAEVSAPFLGRPLTTRTLVIFLVARAYARSGDLDVAFLSGSWSAGPARGVVPEMLRAVWHAAHHDELEKARLDEGAHGLRRLLARALS
jgi:hypothetical protein